MTLVVTFLLSLALPGTENFPQARPALFVMGLGAAFAAGVFLPGWLALRWRWLRSKPMYPTRLIGAIAGAYLPLAIALIVSGALEPGSRFFLASMLGSVLGFHVPGWVKRA
jgi:hypothetical protein